MVNGENKLCRRTKTVTDELLTTDNSPSENDKKTF